MFVCLFVCLFVCSCLNAGLTVAPINLIFGMHTLIESDCAIGYMILTFEVIKSHFRSKNVSLAGTRVPTHGVKVTLLFYHGHFGKFENPK